MHISISYIATYAYDDKGQPISMTRGGATYYYHFNAHGDTIALTDENGNVVQTYKYDIWGNITDQTGTVENPYTYGGQAGYIYDKESGLYFLQTRYYDPTIGRFISRDRFAGFENDSDSQNRYIYCQNDPVNNVDPTGQSSVAAVLLDIVSVVTSMIFAWFPPAEGWKFFFALSLSAFSWIVTVHDYNVSIQDINADKTLTNAEKQQDRYLSYLGLVAGKVLAVTTIIFTMLGYGGRLGVSKYLKILNSKLGMKILNAVVGVCLGFGGSTVFLLNDITSLAYGKFHWF